MSEEPAQPLFRSEYRKELDAWLRRRFQYLCITYLALGVLDLISGLLGLTLGTGGTATEWVLRLTAGVSLPAIVAYFFLRRHQDASREQVLRSASLMILLLGAISVMLDAALIQIRSDISGRFLLLLFFWHLSACLFMPWRPKESLRPVIPLFVAWAVSVLILEFPQRPAPSLLTVAFGPGIFIPGLGICSWRLKRHSREFRTRMVGRHFMTMRRELSRAREIHESMFPAPHDDGHVRLEYSYQPMRELGGDFVHLHVGPQGVVHVALIDVTGHGLAAALTVNRLYGELERIRAESPSAAPGEVLTLLNRYFHLTMVRHNIYATAMCLLLDPYEGRIIWANAGHPPALLRGANGSVTPLDPTAVMLGAMEPEAFEADEQSMELSPGDCLIGYTDGVLEAMDGEGEPFGLDRLKELLTRRPAPRNWPQFVASVVDKHRAGRADDDVLIASLGFIAQRREEGNVSRVRAQTSIGADDG